MAASWLHFCRTQILRVSTRKTCLEIVSSRSKGWQWFPRTHRPISTTSFLCQDEAQLEDNPYFEKYADKIKVAQELNKNDDKKSFQDMFKVDKRVLHEANRFKAKIKENSNTAKKTMTIDTHSESGSEAQYGDKTLDSVLNMDLITELSGEEIGKLWKEYHKDKDCISAVIPAHVYKTMEERSTSYPLFIYPLPRENGYEFIYSEFSGKHCYLTSILNYQTMAENAPWFMALTHFTELADTKGIVLMVGEVDTKQLNVVDAQWLAYQIQMYYASSSPHREELLQIFNNEPLKFNHMSVVEQLNDEIASGALTADALLKTK